MQNTVEKDVNGYEIFEADPNGWSRLGDLYHP